MDEKLKETIRWYRELDFSGMKEDVRQEILSLNENHDAKPSKTAKLEISVSIILIGQAFKDENLIRLGLQAALTGSKPELIEIIEKTSNKLKDSKFS
ncbi:hypothetical protein R7652_000290 [Salmonella enterica]|uniref:hypothetical protein n=1 Tax=Escherichia coli TaxID=562 RepID=UPI0005306BF3|nr:hypothetical protein [Escherichia coli]EAO9269404.1 hypothetical protein [Salmonella enterica]EAT0833924.1 hypothetical protein [Salmonella enterica]EEG8076162.1 hypothetical protein [Salmonella enterica]EGF9875319.1 hypothetical protein [Salmonella enterica]EGJ4047840.1 hypothetical protein [Salmonella enterica]